MRWSDETWKFVIPDTFTFAHQINIMSTIPSTINGFKRKSNNVFVVARKMKNHRRFLFVFNKLNRNGWRFAKLSNVLPWKAARKNAKWRRRTTTLVQEWTFLNVLTIKLLLAIYYIWLDSFFNKKAFIKIAGPNSRWCCVRSSAHLAGRSDKFRVKRFMKLLEKLCQSMWWTETKTRI